MEPVTRVTLDFTGLTSLEDVDVDLIAKDVIETLGTAKTRS